MLYRADDLTKFEIQAADGSVGSIKDLYFDDMTWIVRYLVVDTRVWLPGRKVLISPEAVNGLKLDEAAFTTPLTRQQIEESPAAESEKTVSRHFEEKLSKYYGWSPYWMTELPIPWPGIYSYPTDVAHPSEMEKDIGARADSGKIQDVHLRGFKEIKGYGLHATDGDIGELDDLLIDSTNWLITHLVADSRKWWPGGQVVIDKGMVQEMSWPDRKIMVAMTRDEVKQAPPYDQNRALTASFQTEISDYYRKIANRTRGETYRRTPESMGQQPQL